MSTATEARLGEHAQIIEVEYRSPEWHAVRRDGIAASEIAAVLGISPHTSPFDLWWEKRTGEGSQDENKLMRRGRRYEHLVLEDFAEEHPELYLAPSFTLRSAHRPWQLATPDGVAKESAHSLEPIAAVEAKTAQRWQWGEPGSDEIPIHYRAQVLWQMDVLGVNVAYLPVLFGDQYEEYVVEYDEGDVLFMRDQAEQFLASVREDRQPEVAASTATKRRLKKLHPSLVDDEVEIPVSLVRQYQRAKAIRDRAEAHMKLAENKVRHLAGPAERIAYIGPDGKRKTFKHSIYEVAEHVRRASTTDRINFPRKAV